MTFRVKAIKPRKLKVTQVRLQLLNAMRRSGTKDKELARKTTEHWKKQPNWVTDISIGKDNVAILTYIEDAEARQIWNWINEGTKRHPITPVRANYLRFNSNFKSQSKPNMLRTSRGYSGPPVAYRKAVMHPGIKARNWSIEITKLRYKPFKEEMNKALSDG